MDYKLTLFLLKKSDMTAMKGEGWNSREGRKQWLFFSTWEETRGSPTLLSCLFSELPCSHLSGVIYTVLPILSLLFFTFLVPSEMYLETAFLKQKSDG